MRCLFSFGTYGVRVVVERIGISGSHTCRNRRVGDRDVGNIEATSNEA